MDYSEFLRTIKLQNPYSLNIQKPIDFFTKSLNTSNPKSWMDDIKPNLNLNVPSVQIPNIKDTKGYDNIANLNPSKKGDTGRMLQSLAGNIGLDGTSTGDYIGLGSAVVETGIQALGGKETTMTNTFDNVLDFSSKLPLELIPGVGHIAKGVISGLNIMNKYLGPTTKKQESMDDVDIIGRDLAYNPNADQKLGFFSNLFKPSRKRNINKLTDEYNQQNLKANYASYLGKQDLLTASNLQRFYNNKNLQDRLNLYDVRTISAKKGSTINKIDIKKIVKKVHKLKQGGSVNIIPDGAFHSRKNNLPDEIAKDVTNKGIPVISKEGGEVIQHAEIERNEIIFHKELTIELEKLLKEYNSETNNKKKDEIAIKAGKLLTKEILHNTSDNTGLIDQIK